MSLEQVAFRPKFRRFFALRFRFAFRLTGQRQRRRPSVRTIGVTGLCASRSLDVGLQSVESGLDAFVQALAFARSRYYEEFRDGDWQMDGSADLGRIARQQLFIRAAVNGALEELQSSPFGSGGIIDAVTSSVRIDASVDALEAADSLRKAAEEDLVTYTLPVYGDTIDGNAILRLGDGAEPILDYFRGLGPAPAPGS